MPSDIPMAEPMRDPIREPTLTEVVAGIMADFQKLLTQQAALFRAEMHDAWDTAKRAVQPMVAGAAFLAIGLILVGFTGAYALHWAVSPAGSDLGRIPLWACFGIVSLAFLLLGGGLIAMAVNLFESVKAPKETAATMEKNLKALVNR